MKYLIFAMALIASPVSASQLGDNLLVCKVTGDMIYKLGEMRDAGIAKSETTTLINTRITNDAIRTLLIRWSDAIYQKTGVSKEIFWGEFTAQCLSVAVE